MTFSRKCIFGINPRNQVITSHVAQLTVGNYGEAWHLRTAGAVVSMVVPLIVFLASKDSLLED